MARKTKLSDELKATESAGAALACLADLHEQVTGERPAARLTKRKGRVWLAVPLPLPAHLAGRWRETGTVTIGEAGAVGAASKAQDVVHIWIHGWLGFGTAPTVPPEKESHRAKAKAATETMAHASGVVGALGYGPDTFELTEGDRGLEVLGVLPPELEQVVRKWWLWRTLYCRVASPETAPGTATFIIEAEFVKGKPRKVAKING